MGEIRSNPCLAGAQHLRSQGCGAALRGVAAFQMYGKSWEVVYLPSTHHLSYIYIHYIIYIYIHYIIYTVDIYIYILLRIENQSVSILWNSSIEYALCVCVVILF